MLLLGSSQSGEIGISPLAIGPSIPPFGPPSHKCYYYCCPALASPAKTYTYSDLNLHPKPP